MKIHGNGLPPELDPKKSRIGETKGAGRTEPARPVSSGEGDAVELSERAQLLLHLSSRIESVPEARSGRVDAIRQAVAEGRYFVAAESVAERMLSSLAEHPAGI